MLVLIIIGLGKPFLSRHFFFFFFWFSSFLEFFSRRSSNAAICDDIAAAIIAAMLSGAKDVEELAVGLRTGVSERERRLKSVFDLFITFFHTCSSVFMMVPRLPSALDLLTAS